MCTEALAKSGCLHVRVCTRYRALCFNVVDKTLQSNTHSDGRHLVPWPDHMASPCGSYLALVPGTTPGQNGSRRLRSATLVSRVLCSSDLLQDWMWCCTSVLFLILENVIRSSQCQVNLGLHGMFFELFHLVLLLLPLFLERSPKHFSVHLEPGELSMI